MSFTKGAGRFRNAPALTTVGLIAAAAMLVIAAPAMGAADPLKGGSTVLSFKLKVSKAADGATKSGKSATLPISGGSLDPTNGTGTVENGGKVTLKKGKKKVALSAIKTGFGGGTLSAKVGKKTTSLATITGGTNGRAGFGGTVSGASMKLTKAGAKALNKALGTSSFKKGKSLGSAGTSTVPKTVEISSGTQTAHGSTGFGKLATTYVSPVAGPCQNALGNAANKACYGKGVSPVPGTGITASDGAVYSTPGGPITSPINPGSSIAPDASAGTVKAAGTTKIAKTVSAAVLYGGGCPEVSPGTAGQNTWPVGNFIQFNNTTNDFTNKVVNVDLTLQAPKAGFVTATQFGTQVPSGGIDMSSATVTSNAATKTIDITGYKVFNQVQTQADLINATFGVGAADCGATATDAAIGDALFSVDLHLTTH
ncbi:MAG: hypothetical protein QOE53_3310 [Pseudonocardiales bacterium]|nr:hypothetical protein [Pseudonocardiales bacterium]